MIKNKKLKTIIRKNCRVCNSSNLSFLFSIGNQYVNNFINKNELKKQIKAPLELIICENCFLVQLRHTAPQELLYRGFYWYKSGVTNTMKNALRDITEQIEKEFKLEFNVPLLLEAKIGTNWLDTKDVA